MTTLSSIRLWFKTAYFVRGFLMVLIMWTTTVFLATHFGVKPLYRQDPQVIEGTISLLKFGLAMAVIFGFIIAFGMRGQDCALAFQDRIRARFGSDPNVRGWWVDRNGLRLYLNHLPAGVDWPVSTYPATFEGLPVEVVYRVRA